MRKIDLTNYDVEILTEQGLEIKPFSAKIAMSAILYHPDLRLGFRELFENDKVAQKINVAQDSVLLEEAEYQKLKHAFETIKGFGKEDVELVRRVMEAPEVEVKET
jgi:hypothetical protein